MKKQIIGWILLVIYYMVMLIQAFGSNRIGWILGMLLAPFITIPANLILLLIADFWGALLDVAWLALGLYLITREE